ncbi:hypothetical protein LEP1GSC034_1262 [Leptospira interrogans str. 2003000735]|uniref:Uncharacterized protein n=7 Tax=Leptospira interrogans TaxID=173 RepID=A0A0E2DBV3_LEPIR|nr:hypothetical protein LEP1GSC045_2093 [Leptospira interrogans serovar Pomona str. Kennewicki LC82-25]EJP13404.1 hypothetical protein LEP1GSC080_2640 [Leptospira interrogans str. FPW2026]EKN86268.1 hypothetical protein LEP1GSC027_2323 [Leptospira interrogans str. 2002000624]EKN98113.1 hypothetical protein LEP1GSC014_1072 [Leptospira interrogans serovar Pomona str. Pomona]EKO22728.1 hypothetical protein LEP1GSC104_1457 [Leptospira interrogans str. UI 12621]EKO88626.1 hypothetical protein LEP1G
MKNGSFFILESHLKTTIHLFTKRHYLFVFTKKETVEI